MSLAFDMVDLFVIAASSQADHGKPGNTIEAHLKVGMEVGMDLG